MTSPSRHDYVTVLGVRTHARVWGSGPPLVIVPGLGCSAWMYTRLARRLARTHTVYGYDPPGHGLSGGTWWGRADLPGLVEHLRAWLTVKGFGSVPIVGHSLGGEVLFDLAARHPECLSALIAVAPTGIPENPSVRVQLARLMKDLPRERGELMLRGIPSYLRCGPLRMLRLARGQVEHLSGPHLHLVHTRNLLIYTPSDPVIHVWTVKALRDRVPGNESVEVPGGTHAVTDSCPDAVADAIQAFLH